MRYYRARKPAWELKAGDFIESSIGGVSVQEEVTSVRRLMFTGDFGGKYYQESPMVRFELGGSDAVKLEPGDTEFTVWRPKGKVTA